MIHQHPEINNNIRISTSFNPSIHQSIHPNSQLDIPAIFLAFAAGAGTPWSCDLPGFSSNCPTKIHGFFNGFSASHFPFNRFEVIQSPRFFLGMNGRDLHWRVSKLIWMCQAGSCRSFGVWLGYHPRWSRRARDEYRWFLVAIRKHFANICESKLIHTIHDTVN